MPIALSSVQKRAILATARTQFSSQLQPLKQEALDHIVMNLLFAVQEDSWAPVDQVSRSFRTDSGGYVLNHNDTVSTLRRLESAGSVERHPRSFASYRLTTSGRASVEALLEEAKNRLERVIVELFGATAAQNDTYPSCFLAIISEIFATFGQESALIGISSEEIPTPVVDLSLDQIVASSQIDCVGVDQARLSSGLNRFFQEEHPDFVATKWNLQQNLFVARVLGMDPSGTLLSKDLFSDAVFYLDTNLVIPAFIPDDPSHVLFITLVECANSMGAELRICSSTLQELEAVVNWEREQLRPMIGKVPESFLARTNSTFARHYASLVAQGNHPTLDDVFSDFSDPRSHLAERYNVVFEADDWFVTAHQERSVTEFARVLQQRQKDRGKVKRASASIHDAITISWVGKQRHQATNGVWLVTTDGSLPGAVPQDSRAQSLAILATTLLQWISPVAGSIGNEFGFAVGFSRLIKERLLPHKQFLNATHFRILTEHGIDLQALPESDVEKIYFDINEQFALLDPTDPSDREKISLIVQTEMAGLEARRSQNIARLEAENLQRAKDFERERLESQTKITAQESVIARLQEEYAQLGEAHKAAFSKQQENYEANQRRSQLAGEAQNRVIIVLTLLIAVWIGLIWAASRYSDEINLWEQVKDFWPFFAISPPMAIAIALFWTGKDRLEASGWRLKQVLGRPDTS